MTTKPTAGRPHLDETTRMAKAMAHPLRGRILVHLSRQGTASPVDLSRALGEPIGNVSYHVRMLLGLDCIELVDTRQRRGAIEHFYRATRHATVDDETWFDLDDEGWTEVERMLDGVRRRALELQAEAESRPADERRRGRLFLARQDAP
jgi:DNA-binding transcriptional ArsR family regulator